MPLFTAKKILLYKNRPYTPGDLMNLTISEADDLLISKKIDYLSEEERKCHTAQSKT